VMLREHRHGVDDPVRPDLLRLSILIEIPVLIPGPTIIGARPK